MLSGHLKKLLLIVPLLATISIIIFFTRFVVPQDPVEQSLGVFHQETNDALPYSRESYIKEAKNLGLNKAKFYFSIRPNYLPKQFDELVIEKEINVAKKLLENGNSWEQILEFLSIKRNASNSLILSQITKEFTEKGFTETNYSELPDSDKSKIDQLTTNKKSRFYFPAFYWNGLDNQYHHWISELVSSNELRSHVNNNLVMPKIKKALAWTLSISLLSILLSYTLGIFLGYNQVSSDKVIWQRIQTILDVFFTMPLFWIATLAIVFFTTSDYGRWTNIFPSVHSMDFSQASFWKELLTNFHHLFLPIICYVLHSTGYISSIMASNLKAQLNQPYILTAKQKGLSNKEIIRQHGLKNALFPILTLLTSSIPSAVSGSLILEIIFNVPGIGRLLYNSILLADWNIVFPIVLIIAIVTALSFWLADILYEKFDPRLKTS